MQYPILATLTAAMLFVIVAVVLFLWRRRASQPPTPLLPPDAAALASQGSSLPLREELTGSVMAVAVGTYGVNELLAFLTLLERCGLETLIGSVLVIECDAQVRASFGQAVPDCYRDGRITAGFTRDYSGGMANKSIDWVLARISEWGRDIENATRLLLDTHYRRNDSRNPALVMVFQSLGGQAPLSIPVLATLGRRFDGTSLIVGATALPRHERLRPRWQTLKTRLEPLGLSGWLLSDNLGPDPTTNDYAQVALLVGMADAARHGDQPTQLNNALALALTEAPGGVLIYQTVAASVVAHPITPRPKVPPYHYVYKQPLVVQVQRALKQLAAGTGVWSVPLTVAEPGTSTFDVCLLSVEHQDLIAVQDAVVAGFTVEQTYTSSESTHLRYGSANYELGFASLVTQVLDPARPVCPVVCVRLTSVRDGAALVEDIVRIPQARQLAAPGAPAPSRNGTAVVVGKGGF